MCIRFVFRVNVLSERRESVGVRLKSETRSRRSTEQTSDDHVAEAEQDAAVLLCGGPAEHSDRRAVCCVCRTRHRVLVNAPSR